MNPWVLFIACFALTAFVGLAAAVVHGLGHQVGVDEEADQ